MDEWDNHIEVYGNEIDVWDGFTDNIYTHKQYGELFKCIKEKGDFTALKYEFTQYRDNAYSGYEDERFVFVNNDPDKISDEDWQTLQNDYVSRAKDLYEDKLTEEQLDFLDFDNRKNLTPEHWNEVFSFFITKQELEKRHLEQSLPYAQTLSLLEQTQPVYEPGTYFTDAVDKVNELNAPKKRTHKI